jgi:hypothetical protein
MSRKLRLESLPDTGVEATLEPPAFGGRVEDDLTEFLTVEDSPLINDSGAEVLNDLA